MQQGQKQATESSNRSFVLPSAVMMRRELAVNCPLVCKFCGA